MKWQQLVNRLNIKYTGDFGVIYMINNVISRYRSFKERYIVTERRRHEYFINRYYAHIIDPFFTKLVFDLKLTPNMVTILSFLIGTTAALSFATYHWVAGAILLQLHHFLDGADGNLARLTNRCTPFGAKLDKICDQILRLFLFVSIAWAVDVPIWVKAAFVGTIYLDVIVIQYYVVPFMKNHTLVRAPWKQWFLDRGIIPSFDIFTVYFLISVFALLGKLDILVYIVIVGKNLDWLYRVYECRKSKLIYGEE